jgi:hypothetical protein
MTPSAEILKRLLPADPDRVAETVNRFLASHGDWAAGISVRQWEAVRRLAPSAKKYADLSEAFDSFLKEAKNRAKEGQGWDAIEPVSALQEIFKNEASQPDGSRQAEFYHEYRQREPSEADEIEQVVRLRLAQRFLGTLTMEVLNLIRAQRDRPEFRAEGWVSVHSSWVEGLSASQREFFVSAAKADDTGKSWLDTVRENDIAGGEAGDAACTALAQAMQDVTAIAPAQEASTWLSRFFERLDAGIKCPRASQEAL